MDMDVSMDNDFQTLAQFVCRCKKIFKTKNTLYCHQQNCNAHCEVENKQPKVYICSRCNSEFSRQSSLSRHKKQNCVTNNKKKWYPCSFENCELKFYLLQSLTTHVANCHNVEIVTQNLVFESDQEFCQWKETEEVETNSYFPKRNAAPLRPNPNLGVKNKYGAYYCKFHGLPEKKNQSDKVICYAHIYKRNCDDGLVRVKYVSTHTHELSGVDSLLPIPGPLKLEMLWLSETGFGPTEIYKRVSRWDVRRDEREKRNQRTRVYQYAGVMKLLNNGKLNKYLSFRLDGMKGTQELVSSWRAEEYDPVLVYKPLGEVSEEFPSLDEHHFVFGFQTKEQRNLWNNALQVHVDLKHFPQYQVYLLSIVMQEWSTRTGYPSATFVINSTDPGIVRVCFEALKRRGDDWIGRRLFMAPNYEVLAIALNVFDPYIKPMLCHKNVFDHWRTEQRVQRDDIKIILKKLLKEGSRTTWRNQLFLKFNVVDPEFIKFLLYLEVDYLDVWDELTFHTNILVAEYHELIKEKYLSRVTEPRLDKLLFLISEVEIDYYDGNRLTETDKTKIRGQDITTVKPDTWEVKSRNGKKQICTVKRIAKKCGVEDCSLVYGNKGCRHLYVCDCEELMLFCRHVMSVVETREERQEMDLEAERECRIEEKMERINYRLSYFWNLHKDGFVEETHLDRLEATLAGLVKECSHLKDTQNAAQEYAFEVTAVEECSLKVEAVQDRSLEVEAVLEEHGYCVMPQDHMEQMGIAAEVIVTDSHLLNTEL